MCPRFPNESAFARYGGLAPIPAWSGSTNGRLRVCHSGNRQINTAIHHIAVVQLRIDCAGKDYYQRRRAAGDSGASAVRCLKRRLFRVVFNRMRADYARRPSLDTGDVTSACNGLFSESSQHLNGGNVVSAKQ